MKPLGNDKGIEAETPKTVVAFGVFDLLHPGHIHFLEQAAVHGERLVVVVTRDERCEAEKGRKPVFPLEERLKMIRALQCVSEAIPGDLVGVWGVLGRVAPDIVCIGYDQNAEHPAVLKQLEALSRKPQIIRLEAHKAEQYKTSLIRSRIHS
jgi:FAD synthetase